MVPNGQIRVSVVVAQSEEPVALDTRGPRFESSHRQALKCYLVTVSCIEETKINEKEAGMAQIF